MRGLGILILIVLFFWLVWPVISRWLKRKAMERTENYIRSKMGMPPRDKSRGDQRGRQGQRNYQYGSSQGRRRNPFGPDRYTSEPIIPKEYAEDVEYIETKEFSSTTTSTFETGKKKTSETYHESQISDAEWVDIKIKK